MEYFITKDNQKKEVNRVTKLLKQLITHCVHAILFVN